MGRSSLPLAARSGDMSNKRSLHPGWLPLGLDPADLSGVQAHEATELGLREAELVAD